MSISNPILSSAVVGVLRYASISDVSTIYEGHPGYVDFHDGKWIVLSSDYFRTIGNAQSGADIAQDWLFKLFSLIYGQYGTAIYTATGQVSAKDTAENDWNAGKRLALPDFRGRVLMGNGTGQGGVNRSLGQSLGTETHLLTIAEIPSHDHKVDNVSSFNSGGSQFGGSSTQTSPQATTLKTGGGQAHNNMQPSIVQTLFISAGVF